LQLLQAKQEPVQSEPTMKQEIGRDKKKKTKTRRRRRRIWPVIAIDPFSPKFKILILITNNHTVLLKSVLRI